jgi:hypothetical protein
MRSVRFWVLSFELSGLSETVSNPYHPRTQNPKLKTQNPKLNMSLGARLLAAALMCLSTQANGKLAQKSHEIHRVSPPEKPEIATELTNFVEAFIAAGEINDPAARGKYLAPSIFYYGHARTRAQALRQIASLYRLWPERKFGPVDAIDLFEIPNRRGVYKVTAVYEYKFDNLDEHLIGKSKMTCVLEHDGLGSRIIGVDEKLVRDSTQYRRD